MTWEVLGTTLLLGWCKPWSRSSCRCCGEGKNRFIWLFNVFLMSRICFSSDLNILSCSFSISCLFVLSSFTWYKRLGNTYILSTLQHRPDGAVTTMFSTTLSWTGGETWDGNLQRHPVLGETVEIKHFKTTIISFSGVQAFSFISQNLATLIQKQLQIEFKNVFKFKN